MANPLNPPPRADHAGLVRTGEPVMMTLQELKTVPRFEPIGVIEEIDQTMIAPKWVGFGLACTVRLTYGELAGAVVASQIHYADQPIMLPGEPVAATSNYAQVFSTSLRGEIMHETVRAIDGSYPEGTSDPVAGLRTWWTRLGRPEFAMHAQMHAWMEEVCPWLARQTEQSVYNIDYKRWRLPHLIAYVEGRGPHPHTLRMPTPLVERLL